MRYRNPIVLIAYDPQFAPAHAVLHPLGASQPQGEGRWIAAALLPTDNPISPNYASVGWFARIDGKEYAGTGYSGIPEALVDMQSSLTAAKAGAT